MGSKTLTTAQLLIIEYSSHLKVFVYIMDRINEEIDEKMAFLECWAWTERNSLPWNARHKLQLRLRTYNHRIANFREDLVQSITRLTPEQRTFAANIFARRATFFARG